jgi:DNA-binding MarR family transcriptional regulator
MTAEGLVARQPDPADRRAHRVALNDGALPVLDEIWRLADQARAESLAGLSATDRSQLMKLLQHIHTNLDTLLPGAADHAGTSPHRTPSC